MELIEAATIDKILSNLRYKKEFIYVSSNELYYDALAKTLKGKLKYKDIAPYGKAQHSKIFNNTEAIFSSNQIGYILVYCLEKEHPNFDLNKFLFSMGRWVIKKQELVFDTAIFDEISLIPFIATVIKRKYINNNTYLEVKVTIGENESFKILTKQFKTKKDIHFM